MSEPLFKIEDVKRLFYNELKYLDVISEGKTLEEKNELGISKSAIYRCIDIVDSLVNDESARRESKIWLFRKNIIAEGDFYEGL